MDIRIKDTLYVKVNGAEYTIRANTAGYEHKRIVYFPDVTKSVHVGFSRDFCLENPSGFVVSRTLKDKEVSVSDVQKAIEEMDLPPIIKNQLDEMISSL